MTTTVNVQSNVLGRTCYRSLWPVNYVAYCSLYEPQATLGKLGKALLASSLLSGTFPTGVTHKYLAVNRS